jgi:hypothetical protein
MSLELKKVKVELIRVSAAKAELELRIEERLDEIEKIKKHVQIQLDKEMELIQKIKEMEVK